LRFLHAADPAALCEDFGEEARLAVNAARPGQVALSLAELGYRSPVGTQAITTIGGTATQASASPPSSSPRRLDRSPAELRARWLRLGDA
jgi:hypothetical protein